VLDFSAVWSQLHAQDGEMHVQKNKALKLNKALKIPECRIMHMHERLRFFLTRSPTRWPDDEETTALYREWAW